MISLSGIYLKIGHFPVKIGLIGGVGGVPEIRFSLESSSFCYLGAHAKFHNPSCLLSGRKVTSSEREREEEEKIMASTMVTTSAPAQRRSDQNEIVLWSKHSICSHLVVIMITFNSLGLFSIMLIAEGFGKDNQKLLIYINLFVGF